MSKSKLSVLFEDYLYFAPNTFENRSTITQIIEEIFRSGFDQDSIEYFSTEYSQEKKQELLLKIFNELTQANEAEKLKIQDSLSTFLIETNLTIQEQILPLFKKNLLDKKDFKLVFTTLKIFTSKWDDFSDEIKKEIYFIFLKVLDNPFDIFIEEGIYEITKIVINSKSSLDLTKKLFSEEDVNNFFQKLIKTALKSKSDPLYAALESIKQIIDNAPNLVTKDSYGLIFPLFKKISKKFAFFYPAKRDYIKSSLSFVNLILTFEKFYDENYLKYFKIIISKMVDRIDHADVKYLLELVTFILKNTKQLPKVEVIQPTFPLLRDLNNKKDRIEGYINDLVEEIINIIWPMVSDKDKDLFFLDPGFGSTSI
jgi:hypothetical protein